MPQLRASDTSSFSETDIRQQLNLILGLTEFEASDRRREMLSFVVEETLAGRSAGIKATTVAMAVFGRGADFDQQTDPVVRLEARRLRYDLDHYYAGAGRDDPIRIDIPKGHYRPTFSPQLPADQSDEPDAGEIETDVNDAATTPSATIEPRPRRFWARLTVPLATFLIGIGMALFWIGQGANSQKGDAYSPATNPSIRINRFRTPDPDPLTALLATGLTHEVAARLLETHNLQVHMMPKGQADADANRTTPLPLNGYLLHGSVVREGNNLVVRAELRWADDGRLLWSGRFEETAMAPRVRAIQDKISAQVVAALSSPDVGGLSRGDI